MKRRGMVMPLVLVVLVSVSAFGFFAIRLLSGSEKPLRRDMVATLVTNAALDSLARTEHWLANQRPLPARNSGVVTLSATDGPEELLIALPDHMAAAVRDGVEVQVRVY